MLRAKLTNLFNIQPGEGRLVLLMLAQYFFLGVAFIFVQAAAFALFLASFTAQDLPYVYIASAVAVTLIALIYLKLSERLSFVALLQTNLGFLLVSIVFFRLGLIVTEAKWLFFALPILNQALVSLGNLEFWTLAGRLFNVRQGKRLFGLIGGGQWIAGVITGFLTPTVVNLIGTPNLLILGAGGVAIALGLLIYINRSFSNLLITPTEQTPGRVQPASPNLLKSRYVLLIFAIIIFWWVSFFFIDNIFYDRAVVQYPDPDQLAGFIGLFFGVTGILTLFSTMFVTGPVIGRYGVRVGVLVLPVALTIGAVLFALSGTIFGLITFLLWLVTLTKLFNFALGFSIDRATLSILYQPLPADRRVRAQTAAEGIVYPLAVGLAGVLLLLLINLFGFNAVQLAYVLLFILAAWIVVAVVVGRREYPALLLQALVKRRLGGAYLSLEDKSTVSVLQQALRNPHAGVAIYALNMLAAEQPELFPVHLSDALSHPAPEVRRQALRHVEQLGLAEALDAVKQTLQTETSPLVQAAALRTLATLGNVEAVELVYPYLEDADPQVRLEAIVGLLRNGGVEVTMVAEGKLLQLAVSPKPDERILAAQIIGEVAARNLRQLLEQLLQDENPQVRRAALTATGKAKYPELWPQVVAAVSDPGVGNAATAALIAGGEGVITQVGSAFTALNPNREALIRLARVCGRIGGQQVTALLRQNLSYPDDNVRTHILAALNQCGYQASENDRDVIHNQIKAEIARAAVIVSLLVNINDDSPPPPQNSQAQEAISMLTQVLNNKLAQYRASLFFLLSFIYAPQTVLQARDALEGGYTSPEKQAYALEVLDLLISQDIKAAVFALISTQSPQQRWEQLKTAFPQPKLDRVQSLMAIITGSPEQFTSWIKACSFYVAGRLDLSTPELMSTIFSILRASAPEPLIAETATWTLAQFDKATLRHYLDAADQNLDPTLLDALKQLEIARNGAGTMLSTVEKVLILKTVTIFAGTPDEILVDIATLLKEVELLAGETVFEKGEQGDCMYIIVDGEVRVHDGDHTLNHLGQGDVFGEMAVLDPEPRLASVTALEDTRLLRLDQEPFYELMEDRIEVAQGIIRVLSGHLRNRVRDVTGLKVRVMALEEAVATGPSNLNS